MRSALLRFAVIIPAAVLLLGACGAPEQEEKAAEPARNVRVLELQPEVLAEFFEVSGPVKPGLGTDLSVEESGPVVALPVQKGQAVRAGDLLLELDRTILLADRESAAAQLKVQEFNVDKMRQLFAARKISEMELLTAEAQYEQARSLAAVSARRYERAGLKAPFDGIVTDRHVELGQLAVPGQVVLRLIDPTVLELEAYLTASEVGWVNVGDAAPVSLGEDAETVAGTVSWIGLEADRQTGKFRMEVRIPNPDGRWHAGVIGRARLPKQTLADAVVIPRDAVTPAAGGQSVYVVEGDRAVRRLVELGTDQGALVVVENGLEAGELLVVRGHRDLRDGSLVKITETATAVDGSLDGDPVAVQAGAEVAR